MHYTRLLHDYYHYTFYSLCCGMLSGCNSFPMLHHAPCIRSNASQAAGRWLTAPVRIYADPILADEASTIKVEAPLEGESKAVECGSLTTL